MDQGKRMSGSVRKTFAFLLRILCSLLRQKYFLCDYSIIDGVLDH